MWDWTENQGISNTVPNKLRSERELASLLSPMQEENCWITVRIVSYWENLTTDKLLLNVFKVGLHPPVWKGRCHPGVLAAWVQDWQDRSVSQLGCRDAGQMTVNRVPGGSSGILSCADLPWVRGEWKALAETREPGSEYVAFDGKWFWQRWGECYSCFEGDACAVKEAWVIPWIRNMSGLGRCKI